MWLCLCARNKGSLEDAHSLNVVFTQGWGSVNSHSLLERSLTTYQKRHKKYKPFDPVIPFPGIYPKEIILNKEKGLCTKSQCNLI
jgi:hypothetical protein